MGRGRARGGQGSLARVVPEFGRAGRSVGYGWSAVVTRRTMRAGRDVREEVGTLSFTPASLFVALVLPMLPAHRTRLACLRRPISHDRIASDGLRGGGQVALEYGRTDWDHKEGRVCTNPNIPNGADGKRCCGRS